jgi:hypothetical protein
MCQSVFNTQELAAMEEYSAALFLVPDYPFLSPELHLGRAHPLNVQDDMSRHDMMPTHRKPTRPWRKRCFISKIIVEQYKRLKNVNNYYHKMLKSLMCLIKPIQAHVALTAEAKDGASLAVEETITDPYHPNIVWFLNYRHHDFCHDKK